MKQTISNLKPSALPLPQLLTLMGGDLMVILSFVWIGRSSHNLSITNIFAGLLTALPFVLAWFLVTPWFGIYRSGVVRQGRTLLPRLLPAWAGAGVLALILRALFLGRPIWAGILPTFAAVSLGYIGLLVLLWRLGYIWWLNRSWSPAKDLPEARL